MNRLKQIVCALGVFALTGGLFATPAVADDKPKVKPGGEQKPAPAEGPKVIVIQLDASKLPPDLLKKLLELNAAGTKPGLTTKPAPEKPGTKPAPEKPGLTTKPAPEKPGTKPAVKVISLADAVAIAEKATKGTATKAEREAQKDGTVEFEVEVTDSKGGTSKIVIDGSGNLVDTKKGAGDDKSKTTKKGDDKTKTKKK